MARAGGDLNRIDYRALNADARTQYDTAKRFIQQAEEAIRAKNLPFAKNLADKAAVLATQLSAAVGIALPLAGIAVLSFPARSQARPQKSAEFRAFRAASAWHFSLLFRRATSFFPHPAGRKTTCQTSRRCSGRPNLRPPRLPFSQHLHRVCKCQHLATDLKAEPQYVVLHA